MSLIPIIKVFNPCDYDTPVSVMAVTKDGKLWWKYSRIIPSIVNNTNVNAKIIEKRGGDNNYTTHILAQLFHNIHLYNDLRMDLPQRFVFKDDHTFYYFLEVDVEAITIPLFYRSTIAAVMFTKFNEKPALKISVGCYVDGSLPNTKRRRQDDCYRNST